MKRPIFILASIVLSTLSAYGLTDVALGSFSSIHSLASYPRPLEIKRLTELARSTYESVVTSGKLKELDWLKGRKQERFVVKLFDFKARTLGAYNPEIVLEGLGKKDNDAELLLIFAKHIKFIFNSKYAKHGFSPDRAVGWSWYNNSYPTVNGYTPADYIFARLNLSSNNGIIQRKKSLNPEQANVFSASYLSDIQDEVFQKDLDLLKYYNVESPTADEEILEETQRVMKVMQNISEKVPTHEIDNIILHDLALSLMKNKI